jgi:hypothetical protein
MATRLRAGRSGVRIPVGVIDLSLRNVQTGSRSPPSPHSIEHRGSFQGLSQVEREVNDSLTSSAEVKNEWSYTSTSPYSFVAWTLTPYLRTVQHKYILPESVTCYHSYCSSTVTWHQIQRVPQASCRLRSQIIVCYDAVLTALFLFCLCVAMNMSRSVRVKCLAWYVNNTWMNNDPRPEWLYLNNILTCYDFKIVPVVTDACCPHSCVYSLQREHLVCT